MSVQVRENINLRDFILEGDSYTLDNATIAQISGRTEDLAPFTLMGKVASNEKWLPLTSLAATTGVAVNLGIYIGRPVLSASLAAGDVTDNQILVGGNCVFDVEMLVIENSLTLASTVNATGGSDNVWVKTLRDILYDRGMFASDTVAISRAENS